MIYTYLSVCVVTFSPTHAYPVCQVVAAQKHFYGCVSIKISETEKQILNWSTFPWERRYLTKMHDVKISPMAYQLPASRLFTQPFVQAQIKENIKAPRQWALWGEVTGHRWIPKTQRASNAENVSFWWRHHEWQILFSEVHRLDGNYGWYMTTPGYTWAWHVTRNNSLFQRNKYMLNQFEYTFYLTRSKTNSGFYIKINWIIGIVYLCPWLWQ